MKLEILRVLLPSRLAPSAAGAFGSACGSLTELLRSSQSFAGIVLRKVQKRKIRKLLAIGGTAESRADSESADVRGACASTLARLHAIERKLESEYGLFQEFAV